MSAKNSSEPAEVFKTPILLIVFNRPDTTRQVLDAIKEVRPQKLYVVADGPRKGNAQDDANCAQVRDLFTDLDWECELITWFRDNNVGCGLGPSTGITWFFEQEEMGIILEDDILPVAGFFQFCAELLEKYKEDERIFQISGMNALHGWPKDPSASYFFSRTASIWGWATWRRAWQHFDYRIAKFGVMEEEGHLDDFIYNRPDTQYMMDYLRHTYQSLTPVSWWDYQWMFARFSNSGLCVVPHQNLVRNIGFGEGATHTHEGAEAFHNIPVGALLFPLIHPEFVKRDKSAEDRYFKRFYAFTFKERIGAGLRKFLAMFMGVERAESFWAKLRGRPKPGLYR